MDKHATTVAELELIRDRLMSIGNSLSGDETGNLAVAVHRANSILLKVVGQLEGSDAPESKVMPLIQLNSHDLKNMMFVDSLR